MYSNEKKKEIHFARWNFKKKKIAIDKKLFYCKDVLNDVMIIILFVWSTVKSDMPEDLPFTVNGLIPGIYIRVEGFREIISNESLLSK